MLAFSAEICQKQRTGETLPTSSPALTNRWSNIDMADDTDNARDERWLPVRGYEGSYEVSDQGRVRSLPRTVYKRNRRGGPLVRFEYGLRYLRPSRQQRGHLLIQLQAPRKQRYVHRLVLEAFVGPPPDGMECRHLNGDPSDNRLCNILWGTRLENLADRTRLGEHGGRRGTRQANAVLNEDLVRHIRREVANGRSHAEIARSIGVKAGTVTAVARRASWGWVE